MTVTNNQARPRKATRLEEQIMKSDTRLARLLLPAVIASTLVLTQCSGGGGDDGSGPGDPAAFVIVEAFPSLSFESPLFLTQAPGDGARMFVVGKLV